MKFTRLLFIIFIIFISITQASWAINSEDAEKGEQAKPLSLKECIQKALNNSPYIKQHRINYEMSKKDIKIAQSVYFPTLSAGTGYNFTDKSSSRVATTNTNAFNADAAIKQLIWNFGKSSANIRMEKFNRIAAYYDFDTMVIDTIFDTKVKYYTTLAAKAAIEIDKSNLQINERNYQRINAYFDEGLKSKIDLVNAEVYVTQAKVSLITSENLYKTALIDLNNAMYLAYEPIYNIEVPEQFKMVKDFTPKSLTDTTLPMEDLLTPPKDVQDATLTGMVDTTDYVSVYKFDKFPYDFNQCIELANKNRPDIKAFNATLDAMKQYLLLIKRNYYPELSATGSYGFNGNSVNSINTNTNSFGVGVSLTTSVNIMAEKYKIDNAKLQVELAQNDIDLLKQDIYFDVQQAYVNMLEFESQIPLLEQKVKQTLENLELADGRYSVGLGDYIELQDAKVNYNTAQHSFVKAVFNYSLAKARLEQTIALDQEVTVKLEDNI